MPALSHYKSVQVATASPERLLVMLLQAAQANMEKARAAIAAKNSATTSETLQKAADILLSLDGVLKEEVATELTGHLRDVYRFAVGRLTMAMVTREVHYVDDAARALAPIVEGFSQAAQGLSDGHPAGSAP